MSKEKIIRDGRQIIIVTGYIIRRPIGGLAWHYLNYVIGLALLGHEVYYLEDSGDQPDCFDPSNPPGDSDKSSTRVTFNRQSKNPDYGLKFAGELFSAIGLNDVWAYYDSHTTTWCGPAAPDIKQICSSADLLINVSNAIPMRDWFMDIPCRVLLDTDPVFGQIRHIHIPYWMEQAVRHTAFLTFGENFGGASCSIPDDGFPWKATRQPLAIDFWPVTPGPSEVRFTSIMSWDSYPPAIHNGQKFGLKSDSFTPYFSLPDLTDAALEIAIDCPPDIREKLTSQGWKLRDAIDVSLSPWDYQKYIQESYGEFSIAKHAYVVTRSGWFSERSVAYLASGRPVVAQETGFSDWLTTGCGILSYSNQSQALDCIQSVMENYPEHSRRAREIAREYFDYRVVLPQLLTDSMNSYTEATKENYKDSPQLTKHQRLLDQLRKVIPESSSFILVDDNQWGSYGIVANRVCFPFMEHDGLWWGNPADSTAAINELERLRRAGAGFIVFAAPAFWWFHYYSHFDQHLNSNYSAVLKHDELVIYDLHNK